MRRKRLICALVATVGLTLPAPAPDVRAAAPRSAPATLRAHPTAWMGVWLDDAVDGGVEIIAVVPGGPAALAQLRPGDIILRANSSEIPVQSALRGVMARLKPGDPLQLQLLRAGREFETRVQLVARAEPAAVAPAPAPTAAPSPPALPWTIIAGGGPLRQMGLQLADVTPALRSFYGAPTDAGVLVTRAEPKLLAGRAGIRVGDILVQLGDRQLGSEDQAEASLRRWILDPRQPLSAVVVRDRESRTVTLVARGGSGVEEAASEQRRQEQELLSRRLQGELERLERRIGEIRRELETLRSER